nr:MAG TPA: hypothetical protein [Caudoviricetes sp.]
MKQGGRRIFLSFYTPSALFYPAFFDKSKN